MKNQIKKNVEDERESGVQTNMDAQTGPFKDHCPFTMGL